MQVLVVWTLAFYLLAECNVSKGKMRGKHAVAECKIPASMTGISAKLLRASKDCRSNSKIIVEDGDSLIDDAVVLSGLDNVEVSFLGNLHLKPDVKFWQKAAYQGLPEFQNATGVIVFKDCTYLKVNGGSIINSKGSTIIGYGQLWWQAYATDPTVRRPVLLTLQDCKHVEVSNLRILSPPFWASYITGSQFVNLHHYMLQVVGNEEYDSANSDGVNIRDSSDVEYHHNMIYNTDDCVAIKGMTQRIHVHDLTCGLKTAGVSIGSLANLVGKDEFARDIVIENVKIVGQSRGVIRIKAWPQRASALHELTGGGGRATVHNITARMMHAENSTDSVDIDTCFSVAKDNSDCYGASSLATLDHIRFTRIYSGIADIPNKNSAGSISCTNPKNCRDLKFDLLLYSVGSQQLVALPINGVPEGAVVGTPADIPQWDLPLPNGCYLPRASEGSGAGNDALFYRPLPRDRPHDYLAGVPKTAAGCLAAGFKADAKGLKTDFKISSTGYRTPVFPKADLSEIPKSRVVTPSEFPKDWLENNNLPFRLYDRAVQGVKDAPRAHDHTSY